VLRRGITFSNTEVETVEVLVEVVVELVTEQEVDDAVLVEVLEDDDEPAEVVLTLLLVVEVDGVPVVVELLLVVVSSELVVADEEEVIGVDEVDDVVAAEVDEEVELEELEPGTVRATYAAIPATANMMMITTTITEGARPLLLCSTISKCGRFYLKQMKTVATKRAVPALPSGLALVASSVLS
jgi:hypothetical protein